MMAPSLSRCSQVAKVVCEAPEHRHGPLWFCACPNAVTTIQQGVCWRRKLLPAFRQRTRRWIYEAREGVGRRVLDVVVGVEGALIVQLRHGSVGCHAGPLGEVAGVEPIQTALGSTESVQAGSDANNVGWASLSKQTVLYARLTLRGAHSNREDQ